MPVLITIPILIIILVLIIAISVFLWRYVNTNSRLLNVNMSHLWVADTDFARRSGVGEMSLYPDLEENSAFLIIENGKMSYAGLIEWHTHYERRDGNMLYFTVDTNCPLWLTGDEKVICLSGRLELATLDSFQNHESQNLTPKKLMLEKDGIIVAYMKKI